jgi:Uma2 family endonuclease
MASHPVPQLTVEEYLEIERSAAEKHEFVDGTMVAMSGGSPRHAIISGNIFAFLKTRRSRANCVAFNPDLKVCLDRRRMIAYPDVTVVCGEPEFLDGKRDVVKNPTVVVEVLSPSTEDYDRGKKATFYRLLPSLQEFLLVGQEPVFVEHNRRLGDGTWQIILFQELEAVIRLDSIGVELPVAVIYEDLEWY